MHVIYYPNQDHVEASIKNDDPLLMLVSFDGEIIIVGNIDDSSEHYILLKKAGFSESDIDKYYRIVVNQSGASWTFVCPGSYLNIRDRNLRLNKYYDNGIDEISKALKELHYNVPIDIPVRYRRHFNELKDPGDSV